MSKPPKIETKDFTPLTDELMKFVSNGDKEKASEVWETLKIEWRNEIRRVIEVYQRNNS
jgi:hypothetical protein